MIRNKLAWLLCATTAVACATPTQPTDAGRDASREATVDVVSRPDASRPDSGPTCSMGQIACNGVCVNAQTDNMNCGACGTACPMGQSCMMGACRATVMCTAPQVDCSGTCVNTQTDPANCGACGTACPMGQSCTAGACRAAMMCPVGQIDCGGTCVDTASSASNCGACGNACPMGQTCTSGVCGAPMCAAGETLCGGRCINTQTDATNCGACGNACPMGQTCTAGACVSTMMCPGTQTNCSGTCVDTQTSAANCGACGRACAMGQTCTAGACMGMLVCPMGQTACGAACADLQSDAINCGACGNACPAGQVCAMGACAMPRPMCAAGQTDCTPMAMAPTCVNTQTDNSNCGACGTTCPMGQTCTAGACACAAGQLLCGRTCVNAQTDNNNCGTCGTVCAGGTTCQAGRCACPAGQMGCGMPSVCVNTQTDNANCGTCGTACPAGQTCTAGTCACAMGQTACGMPATCVNTQTDRSNCGMCGRACAMGQTCTAGACACPAGQTVCGAGAAATCVDLQSNSTNCGMCGRVCAMGTSCRMGACMGMPPANDTRAGATLINLAMASQTLAADTTAARNDVSGSCGCTRGNDVFYRFVLTAPELVMAETLGATWDTSLFIQDSMGANVTAPAGFFSCNDDAGATGQCGLGGLQSLIYTRLPAGTYFLVLSGCGAGTASIKFQHLPAGNGTASRIAPDGTVRQAMGTTSGVGTVASTCCSGGAENSFWWLTCPNTAATAFNANSCNPMTGVSLAAYDIEVAQYSALRAATAVCNDDIGGVCANGSSLNSQVPATAANQIGLNNIVVDACSGMGASTVNYVLANCATGTRCGAACADLQNDRLNCGACARRCAGTENCRAGACIPTPSNDLPTAPVVINMAAPQSTFTVDTFSAVNNTSGTCGCTLGNDVFYQFTIAAGQSEIVYADTLGSTRDTSLFIQTSAGANVANTLPNGTTCNDDSGLTGCNTGTQSQVMTQLGAGTYRLVVSGCGVPGATNIRFQHLPVGNGPLAALAAGSSTPGGATAGTGRITGSCNSAGPENTYYWYTCGTSVGGAFTASTCGRATWDTSVHQSSASRAALNVCNDDAGGTCGVRSSISSAIPAGAGIHTLYVDGFNTTALGAYTVAVTRP
jgi:hypothetical protein